MEEFISELVVAFAAAAFAKLFDVIDRKLGEREKASKQPGKHARRP